MATVAPGARKKQKIRPVKKRAPDASEPDIWMSLSNAILEIHNHNASNLSFEQNYRFAYQMVVQKRGDQLYTGVNDLVASNIDKLADSEVKPTFPTAVRGDASQKSHETERFLKAVKSSWDDHIGSMSKVKDLLKYMDRVYVPAAGKLLIWDSGLKLYIEHMLKRPILDHIVSAILIQTEAEREGYAINRSAVKSCVDILLQLHPAYDGPSVYSTFVEPEILRSSKAYYAREGDELLKSCDAPEFLKKVEDRFASEDDRAHHYLSRQTAAPLSGILEETLLKPHLTRIISMPNSGLDNMLDLDQKDNLSRLYRLFSKVPAGIATLKRAMKESILRRGSSLSQSAESSSNDPEEGSSIPSDTKGKGKGKARAQQASPDLASNWVEGVLALKDKFDSIWKFAFASDREIGTACNEAFETFVNQNVRAPEYISLFIDENLKKGLKGKTDQEVDAVLDKTISIFRYITDKDVFERYYKIHLAKRLLAGRSVSDDAERGMLSKLRIECGFHFTQKLEGMFIDMKTSADTTEAYGRHLSKTTSMAPDLDLNITIMTSNNWPNNMTQSPPSCNLPQTLADACTSFEKFYHSRHNGRRLTWQLGLGNADVKVSFNSRKHDLNVSTLALVILLLFEDLGPGEVLSYEEILSSTSIEEDELKRQLQSLACAKFKILKKHPVGREIGSEDEFTFNLDFSSPMQRIKISTVTNNRVENTDERKETRDRIDEERRHQIEACIVRIMKDRKHMLHNDLISEVARQLGGRFQAQPIIIKKRIEHLIERDYLERCDDRKSYNYVA